MHILLLATLLNAETPTAPTAPAVDHTSPQLTCPSDDRYTRAALMYGLVDPEVRTLWGIGNVDPAALRVLTDDRDAALCQHFRDKVTATPGGSTSVQWGYYEIGGYYFVTVRRINSGSFGLGNSVMWVFDSNLQELGLWTL